ncbi:MAG: DUF366 family protein [Candidatus Zixiibacteriota bacterium]
MFRLNCKILNREMSMTKDALFPQWALDKFDIIGDSIVAFKGPFDMTEEEFYNLSEKRPGELKLSGKEMLHFIIEHFNNKISLSVYRQYLLVSIVEEKLVRRKTKVGIIRWGEDIYDEDKILSVSVITANAVSTKIHLGLFIEDDEDNGIRGLKHFDILPEEFAEIAVSQYRAEFKRLADKTSTIRILSQNE